MTDRFNGIHYIPSDKVNASWCKGPAGYGYRGVCGMMARSGYTIWPGSVTCPDCQKHWDVIEWKIENDQP